MKGDYIKFGNSLIRIIEMKSQDLIVIKNEENTKPVG